MATVTIDYFGMPGIGKTVTEAKRDAGSKIEKALTGYYTPTMLRASGLIGIVWREPSGYAYQIIDDTRESGPMYGCSMPGGDQASAIESCAKHMAQNAFSYAGLEKYISKSGLRELDEWFAWQTRYRTARERGFDHDAALTAANTRMAFA